MKLRPAVLLALGTLAPLFCSSCIDHSVNPWFPDKATEFESALLGKWAYEDENEKVYLTFLRDSGGFYPIDYVSTKRNQQKQERGSWKAKLLKLNGMTYLDYQPLESEDTNAWLIPTHGPARLNLKEKSLTLSLLNDVRLATDAKSGRLAELRYTWLQDGDLLLISNTEELYQYLLKHAAEEDFFGKATGPFIRSE
jgi:hypothetical protein